MWYHGKVPRNNLDRVELLSATDYDKEHRHSRKPQKRLRAIRVGTPADGTRASRDTRKRQNGRLSKRYKGNRLPPPPPPKNKSLAEIEEMDPDDPVFKIQPGAPRKWEDIPDDELHWKDLIRKRKAEVRQARRARVRHYEAKVIKAREVLEASGKKKGRGMLVDDLAIAEGVLDLSDWDNEELARGYRRNRHGRFGPAPRYIPREIQQEAFRRLVGRGDHMLREAYIEAMEKLIDLAHNADSEKVRLDAIKELSDRTRGKIPDTLRVEMDAPWQDMLADSFVPIDETEPIEVSGTKRALDSGPDVAGVDVAPAEDHWTAATDGISPTAVERSTPAPPVKKAKRRVIEEPPKKKKKKVPTSTLEDLDRKPKKKKKRKEVSKR